MIDEGEEEEEEEEDEDEDEEEESDSSDILINVVCEYLYNVLVNLTELKKVINADLKNGSNDNKYNNYKDFFGKQRNIWLEVSKRYVTVQLDRAPFKNLHDGVIKTISGAVIIEKNRIKNILILMEEISELFDNDEDPMLKS